MRCDCKLCASTRNLGGFAPGGISRYSGLFVDGHKKKEALPRALRLQIVRQHTEHGGACARSEGFLRSLARIKPDFGNCEISLGSPGFAPRVPAPPRPEKCRRANCDLLLKCFRLRQES